MLIAASKAWKHLSIYALSYLIIILMFKNKFFFCYSKYIPLIGKDGGDVINKITCELTGTESINTQI